MGMERNQLNPQLHQLISNLIDLLNHNRLTIYSANSEDVKICDL